MGTDAAVASLAFKAWWQPSFSFALSGGYDLAARKPRIGLVFNCENYGNIRWLRCGLFISLVSCTAVPWDLAPGAQRRAELWSDRGGHAVLRRYERGQRAAFGSALVQRHVALPQDLANKAGKGLLVRYNLLHVLGSVHHLCSHVDAILKAMLEDVNDALACMRALQVQKDDLDNARILGQTTTDASFVL